MKQPSYWTRAERRRGSGRPPLGKHKATPLPPQSLWQHLQVEKVKLKPNVDRSHYTAPATYSKKDAACAFQQYLKAPLVPLFPPGPGRCPYTVEYFKGLCIKRSDPFECFLPLEQVQMMTGFPRFDLYAQLSVLRYQGEDYIRPRDVQELLQKANKALLKKLLKG